MKLSIVRALTLSFAVLSFAGCAFDATDPQDEVVAEAKDTLLASQGIRVDATYETIVTYPQTYGDLIITPILRVRVTVDDATLKSQFPGFDGMESAFALVPFNKNGSVVWESRALSWTGNAFAGYYLQIRLDVHESGAIEGIDWETLSANGVAVGLNTNMGTIWAQPSGENWPVVKK